MSGKEGLEAISYKRLSPLVEKQALGTPSESFHIEKFRQYFTKGSKAEAAPPA